MANLIDTIVKGTLRVVGSIYGKIWAQAGGSGNQGNVVVSQSDGGTNRSTSITNASASSGSEVGSVYQDSDWWSWVNVRHRNGYSDGNNYGMYIKSLMTADGSLIWNKNYNGAWTGERTILDSSNFVSQCNSYYVAKAGDTMTGALTLTSGSTSAFDKTALSFIKSDKTEQARIGTDANGGLGLYTKGSIYIRPQSTFASSTNGLVISDTAFTYNGTNVSLQGHTHSYLPLSGGTMTGAITLKKDNYIGSGGGINCNNADIIGCNSIYTGDLADTTSEGIRFYRDSTHWDSLTASGGVLYFKPNDLQAGVAFTDTSVKKVEFQGHTHSEYVALTGNQTVNGIKTFNSQLNERGGSIVWGPLVGKSGTGGYIRFATIKTKTSYRNEWGCMTLTSRNKCGKLWINLGTGSSTTETNGYYALSPTLYWISDLGQAVQLKAFLRDSYTLDLYWAKSEAYDSMSVTECNLGGYFRQNLELTWVDNGTSYALADITGTEKTVTARNFLPLAGGTVTGTLVLSNTTDASGTANNSPALIVGGTATQAHIEIDANEVIAKADGTSMTNLYLNEKAIIRTNGAIETYNTVRVGATNVGTGGCVMTYNSSIGALQFTFA